MQHLSRPVRFALLLPFLLWGLTAAAQTTQLIEWTEDLQLSWSMFLDTPPSDAPSNDPSGIHLEIKWHSFHNAVGSGRSWTGCVHNVVVSNLMNPKLSWARSGQTTDSALRHATYHFRLYEVYRRKLEAALLAIRIPASSSNEALELVYNEACRVADQIIDRAVDVRQEYETQTSYGTDAANQQSWEADIDAWLANPNLAP